MTDFDRIISDYQKLRDQIGMVPTGVDMTEETAKSLKRQNDHKPPWSPSTGLDHLLGIPVHYTDDLPHGVIEWRCRTTLGRWGQR